jgi:hypothetical protein
VRSIAAIGAGHAVEQKRLLGPHCGTSWQSGVTHASGEFTRPLVANAETPFSLIVFLPAADVIVDQEPIHGGPEAIPDFD